ncbi:YqjF family protein [Amnibacterium endophyticum]|uniref:YqjF family protein n=1 Tax=Amnibacterium endophyticum TaxID=2109337 RepID=A0ABW4LH89_9MICO
MVERAESIGAARPLPGRAVIRQHWADAVFLHWRVDPAEVAPWLPEGTRPDTTDDGASWVGLIPFRLERTAFPPLPVVPWLGTFLETNVRLYAVDDRGRRSVVFRSLDAQHLLPVLAARVGLGLPYRWARMRARREGDVLAYSSERLEGATRPRTRIRVRLGGPVEADPLAAFLTARWAMHVHHLGATRYWRNEHEAWPLRSAELLDLDDELLAAAGFPALAERAPDSVLFSPGVTTRFSAPA